MKYHLCMNIEGALINMTDAELRGMFQFKDGTRMTPHQARQTLKIEKQMGHRVIPLSECDNFDYQRGCLGHDDDPPKDTQ